jgi:RNA recognition motif-containing protein
VNIEGTDQSKLYVCHIAKDKTFEELNNVFGKCGEIEELYLFKDNEEKFKGSCFIKYVVREQAIKAIKRFN